MYLRLTNQRGLHGNVNASLSRLLEVAHGLASRDVNVKGLSTELRYSCAVCIPTAFCLRQSWSRTWKWKMCNHAWFQCPLQLAKFLSQSSSTLPLLHRPSPTQTNPNQSLQPSLPPLNPHPHPHPQPRRLNPNPAQKRKRHAHRRPHRLRLLSPFPSALYALNYASVALLTMKLILRKKPRTRVNVRQHHRLW
jgi:hypothetical protein